MRESFVKGTPLDWLRLTMPNPLLVARTGEAEWTTLEHQILNRRDHLVWEIMAAPVSTY